MTELFNELKEGLEEAIEYSKGKDTGAYVVQELLPCPYCGTDDLELWHGLGTQADICCNNCGHGYIELQVSDYFTYEERCGGEFDFDIATAKYSEKGVKRGMDELIKAWNTRAKNQREKELEEALEMMIEHYVNLAGCGDCGFWEPEEERKVIEARNKFNNLFDELEKEHR